MPCWHKRRRIAVPLSFFTHRLLTKANPDSITRRAPGRMFIPINQISLSATEEISLFVKNGITLSVLHALICYHLSFTVSSSIEKKKENRNSISCSGIFVSALPIFPVRLQTSIFGRSELNFRVRNGNGWTLALINTDYW